MPQYSGQSFNLHFFSHNRHFSCDDICVIMTQFFGYHRPALSGKKGEYRNLQLIGLNAR